MPVTIDNEGGTSMPGLRVVPLASSQMAAGRSIGAGLFFADSDEDTDYLVEPTHTGFEFSWQLRSQRSPTVLRARVDPSDSQSELREGPSGAIDVVGPNGLLARIAPPVSFDADGRSVPTEMSLHGRTLRVQVSHHNDNFRYPLLVDPIVSGPVLQNAGDFGDPGNPASVSFPNYYGNGSGSFVYNISGGVMGVGTGVGGAGLFGFYYIAAPGSAQIYRVDVDQAYFFNNSLKPAWLYAHITQSASGQVGAWTNNGFDGNARGGLPAYRNTTFGPESMTLCAGHVPGARDGVGAGFCTPYAGASSNQFQIGMYTSAAFSGAYVFQQIGGAQVSFGDSAAPSSVTPTIPGWSRAITSVNVAATQGGLGVGDLAVLRDGTGSSLGSLDLNCYFGPSAGTRGRTTVSLPPCPQQTGARSVPVSGLTEGLNPVRFRARSLMGQSLTSGVYQLKIDTREPEFTLEGGIAKSDGSELDPNATNDLTVQATDFNDNNPVSGISKIVVKMNGGVIGQKQVTCTSDTSGCPSSLTVAPNVSSPGKRTFSVEVTDRAGNTDSEDFSVWVPYPEPTSAKDDRVVDQAGGRVAEFVGPAGSVVGSAVIEIGDQNQDGLSDYAIGAPGFDQSHGAVYVVFGRETWPSGAVDLDDLVANGRAYRITGRASSRLGAALGVLTDVDKDGLPDLAVGAPQNSSPIDTTPGSVFVLLSGQSAFSASYQADQGQHGYEVKGPIEVKVLSGGSGGISPARPSKPFGTVIGTLPQGLAPHLEGVPDDVNGDGRSDIVLGDTAPGLTNPLVAGTAYVLYGKGDNATVDVSNLSPAQGYTVKGAALGDAAGESAAMVGDVNGDDVADMVVGAPGHTDLTSGVGQGAAYVVLGGRSTNLDLASPPVGYGYSVTGSASQASIGAAVAATGDVDNDGHADFALAGKTTAPVAVMFGTEALAATTTATAGAAETISVSPYGDSTGELTVAGVGDLDGDDTPDVFIGSPGANSGSGAAFQVYLKPYAKTINLASAGGETYVSYTSSAAAQQSGTSLAYGGSRSSGATDLLLGMPSGGRAVLLEGPAPPGCLGDVPVTAGDSTSTVFTCMVGSNVVGVDRTGDGTVDETRALAAASSSPKKQNIQGKGDTSADGKVIDKHTWRISRTILAERIDSRGEVVEVARGKFRSRIRLKGNLVFHSGAMFLKKAAGVYKLRMLGRCYYKFPKALGGDSQECLSTRGINPLQSVYGRARLSWPIYGPTSPGADDYSRSHRGTSGSFFWSFYPSALMQTGTLNYDISFAVPLMLSRNYRCREKDDVCSFRRPK